MLCEEMEVRLQHKITFITPSSVRMWLYPVITQVSAGRYSRKNVKPPRVHFSVDPRCLSHFVWGSLLREWLTVKLAAAAALSHSSKLFFLPTHTLTLFQDSVKHNRHKLTDTHRADVGWGLSRLLVEQLVSICVCCCCCRHSGCPERTQTGQLQHTHELCCCHIAGFRLHR